MIPVDIQLAANFIKDKLSTGEAIPVELSTQHHFSDNIYCREIFMPAGSVVIGKEHATRHLNIVLSGECYIWTVQEKLHLFAGQIFESQAGIQKVVKMVTDVRFLTIHFNPDNITDQSVLEGMYIRASEQLPLFPELGSIPLFEKRQERLI